MGRTSRKKIAILDEGVVLVADADSIDFAGAGVTGGAFGNAITETIPGGGGGGPSGTPVYGEAVSFSGTSGTLAHVPTAGTVRLFRGGVLLQNLAVTGDYTISGAVITLITAASAGEVFLADYSY